MSWSVSSFRPGRTSRRTRPLSPRRYWPTQSSRGGVDVDGDGRLSLLVAHAMDVPGAAPARVPGPKVELDVRRPVDEEILADTALRAAQPDARDVVVVEAGSLPGQPREHPGVDMVVL